MNTFLALNFGGPLMLLFGVIAAVVVGAVAGYVIGAGIGRTQAATPLPTTVRVTRDALASTTTRLEKASRELNSAARSELAGHALILARRVTEASTALGRIEKTAERDAEVGA